MINLNNPQKSLHLIAYWSIRKICEGLPRSTPSRYSSKTMFERHSPWIEQLQHHRQTVSLTDNHATHIAIVGAGIAGVSTAYFLLKETNYDIALVEAGKAAHGATGYNAGQVVSYFERQFAGLVKEYGLDMAAKAQSAIDSTWLLIEQIYAETKITTPFAQFTGYAGCQDRAEVLLHLENIIYCRQAGLTVEPLIIAEDCSELANLPDKYYGLYTKLPQKDILSLLETEDSRYIAVVSARKGCMNSALFCEDLIAYLLATYPDRFVLLEDSPVSDVALYRHKAILSIRNNHIQADRVVLCTNGFENFTITNIGGQNISRHFHHLVKGSVGYMAAYLEEHQHSPIAISYLPKREGSSDKALDSDPYFYLTRRTFERDQEHYSLICIGGPEALMDDTNGYKESHPYPKEAQEQINHFLHKTYKHAPKGKIKYTYQWHGLMGYTPNGVRCIGPEPINPTLLYNLGCNGVGILPSIYGGKKIALFLNSQVKEPSIFDPKDYRKKKPSLLSSLQRLLRGK